MSLNQLITDMHRKEEEVEYLVSVIRGIRCFVDDGNVIELHPCGFIEELDRVLAAYAGASAEPEDEDDSGDDFDDDPPEAS